MIMRLQDFAADWMDPREGLRSPFPLKEGSSVVVACDGQWIAWRRFYSISDLPAPDGFRRPDMRYFLRLWRPTSRRIEASFWDVPVTRHVDCEGCNGSGKCYRLSCDTPHQCGACAGEGVRPNRSLIEYGGYRASVFRLFSLRSAVALVGEVRCVTHERRDGAVLPFSVDGLKGILWLRPLEGG